jgi:hypothetical protein
METFLKYKNQDLDFIYSELLNEFKDDSLLVSHRKHIQENNLGYGEDPFHVVWREVVKSQPTIFSFLEIGVYKGQVLSLVKLLSREFNKNVDILGVSPLDGLGDKYSKYDKVDYRGTIENLFKHFNLDFDFTKEFIQGNSIDESTKLEIKNRGIFDVVYIDGCHDYECVISDIELMKEITKSGSIIIMDDASCYKKIQRINTHKGHPDVCRAISEQIESSELFEEIICVGHNRIFKRVK